MTIHGISCVLLALAAACDGATSEGPCVPGAPGTICTIAGDGLRNVSESGVPALEAHLDTPRDVAISPDGEPWILDFNNYYVKRIAADGNLYTMVGNGLLGNAPGVGEGPVPALDAPFNHTSDLLFVGGFLYLAGWHNSLVKRIDLATMEQANYAGIGKRTRYTGDGGPALEAALDLPSALALDPDGAIVVLDQANQVVRRIDRDGAIDRVAGRCVVDFPVACGEGIEPVTCPGSQKLTCGDPATTCCTSPDPETGSCDGVTSNAPCVPLSSGDGGLALDARIAQPYGSQAWPAGGLAYSGPDLIIAETEGHRIRRVDEHGVISTIAGTGEAGYSGDGGLAHRARLNAPQDLAVAADGAIYVADTGNSCVRKLTPRPAPNDLDLGYVISTVAGVCDEDPRTRGFTGDGGDPREARLSWPGGIELDGDFLYVADSNNNRVRLVNLAGLD